MPQYLEFKLGEVTTGYREMVDRYFRDMDGERFQNHSIFHAWYVFKKILEYARRERQNVAIVSGILRADFFNALVEDFEETLKAGSSVRIIVTEGLDRGCKGHANKITEELNTSPKVEIHVRKELRDVAKKQPDQEGESGERYSIPHMVVCADGGCYRVETETRSHSSIVAFGDHESGGMLHDSFNDYMDTTVATGHEYELLKGN